MKIYGNLNSMESYQFNKFLAFQQKHFLSNNLKKQKKVRPPIRAELYAERLQETNRSVHRHYGRFTFRS